MKKYLSEFFGTYIMVFCGTGAIVINDLFGSVGHIGIGLTFGFIVTAMIYSFAQVSGAHINPAVSIAFYFSKQLTIKPLFLYIIFQSIGAVLASISLKQMFPNHELLGSTIPSVSWQTAFAMEFILTFILMLVIFMMASNKKNKPFLGIVVGLVVGLEAIFAGPITGASMNPARSFGPALVSQHFDFLWIYLFATTLGAITSFYVYRFFKDAS